MGHGGRRNPHPPIRVPGKTLSAQAQRGPRLGETRAARQRFVEYTHGLIRELMTNYGKVDILWYDVDWPLSAEQWESERMNQMVFELQPGIIVNNRNGLEGDFSTPEQQIEAAEAGRAW